MVLEILVSNFFSINDEVILDLRAGNINAAKSNIIKTIRFCNAMVYEYHKHNENTIFNFKPFKFKGYSNKPSCYYIRFVIKDIEYKYSFLLSRTQILREKLY